MAKRKRLGPAAVMGADAGSIPPIDPVSAPPIAQVAGRDAAQAAAQEMADALASARAEGRLVQDIALEDIRENHLSRDRVAVTLADLAALEASIAARGQQMPIEVVDLHAEGGADADADSGSPRYGLISGWRRLQAIKALRDQTGDSARYGTVRAVLRRPSGAAEAYLSMVEENELRVGLSYYERAQVAARASDAGVFDGSAAAIAALFPTASKAKRSKIGSFVRVFRVLDPVLHFPSELPERLGLTLARALDAGHGGTLYQGLRQAEPPADPAAELARIAALLEEINGSNRPNRVPYAAFEGIEVTRSRDTLKLSGPGVTDDLARAMAEWLSARVQGDGG